MKNLTLTPHNLEQFAESGRRALDKFYEQFKQMQPKLLNVTRDALDDMVARIDADPQSTRTTPGIDHTVYYAAFFLIGAKHLEGVIEGLTQTPDVTTLHSLFQRTQACANTINALLLASQGLLPQLHFDEAQSIARKTVASNAANKLHAPKQAAKAWVVAEYLRDSAEYPSKADFARIYAARVPLQFNGVKVTAETIAEKWLSQK